MDVSMTTEDVTIFVQTLVVLIDVAAILVISLHLGIEKHANVSGSTLFGVMFVTGIGTV